MLWGSRVYVLWGRVHVLWGSRYTCYPEYTCLVQGVRMELHVLCWLLIGYQSTPEYDVLWGSRVYVLCGSIVHVWGRQSIRVMG